MAETRSGEREREGEGTKKRKVAIFSNTPQNLELHIHVRYMVVCRHVNVM